jgi:GDP-L-fucose synthase
VIPTLIHKCYISKIKDKDFVVKGSGRALRQFIYSEDLARIMIWMIDNYREVNNLIISVDEDDEITIGEVAGMIADEYGYRDRMIFETNGIDGQYKKTADNSKLRRYLGEYRFKNMRDGIRESVKWFKENYPNVRK